MELVELRAPLLVAKRCFREVSAWNLPALDMLGAYGDTHGPRGLGGEAFEHFAHAPAVEQFLGELVTAGGIDLAIRVGGIGGVDQFDRSSVASGFGKHGVVRWF